MGLLDQVLGQVLGGAGMSSAAPSGGIGSAGGGGGLGGLLSGNRAPIAMALLALLASKHLNNGAGGYGSALHDMFSGGTSPGGTSPAGTSTGGTPAGGILDKLGSLLGSGNSAGMPGSGGGLGSLLGSGVTGGALAGGLGELLSRFGQNGHGTVADSWVGHGPNAAISPDQLDQVLDSGTVDELSRQTGLGRGDLLSQLSTTLPHVVDKLTPHGRLPYEDEHSQWI